MPTSGRRVICIFCPCSDTSIFHSIPFIGALDFPLLDYYYFLPFSAVLFLVRHSRRVTFPAVVHVPGLHIVCRNE